MNKDILAALQAMGLVAGDATEQVAVAVLAAWYAGQGKAKPGTDAEILADLRQEKQKPPSGAAPQAAEPQQTSAAGTADISSVERNRVVQIQTRGQLLGADQAMINAAIADGRSVEQFLTDATDSLALRQRAVGRIEPRESSDDRFHEAASEALMLRLTCSRGSGVVNPLRYKNALSIAAESLRGRGVRGDILGSHSPDTIARAALGDAESLSTLGADSSYNSPGAFPHILASIARRTLDSAPQFVGTTFQHWAVQRPSIPDFKPASLARIGEFGEFPLHVDGDDFEQTTTSEEASWIQVDSYGHEFRLTPLMIINDDLGAFSDALVDHQQAHDQTINRLCVNLLVGNIACSDGNPLFHTAHGNDRTSGAAPSTSELSALRLLLRNQTGVSRKRKLNNTLFGLLVPAELETATQQLLAATLSINPTQESATPVFKGQATWWVEPMLSDHSSEMYYGFANPALCRSIVYAYQTGYERMQQRSYYNPKNNCRIYQFEGRFAAAANHWRGIVRNAGT